MLTLSLTCDQFKLVGASIFSLTNEMKTDSVAKIARSVFSRAISYYDKSDIIRVTHDEHQRTRIFYVCAQLSRESSNATFMECFLNFERSEMDISGLQVATAFRSRGIGRQLVQAAEAIARSMGIRRVIATPLAPAEALSKKMQYSPHDSMPHVVSKLLKNPQWMTLQPQAKGCAVTTVHDPLSSKRPFKLG